MIWIVMVATGVLVSVGTCLVIAARSRADRYCRALRRILEVCDADARRSEFPPEARVLARRAAILARIGLADGGRLK